MSTSYFRHAVLTTLVFGAAIALPPFESQAQNLLSKGEYIFNLAGCEGCHTDKKGGGQRLVGGRAFKTDFGTFYSPNITPDLNTGIGKWTHDDFSRALRHGIAPDGSNYFPIFPYTSYTKMSGQDIHALWTYLQDQTPIAQANRDHDLKAPFGWRRLMKVWNWLYLDAGPKPDWSRGRYLVEALAHCRECHTPRNLLGGYKTAFSYAGTPRNPEGIEVPNITPDPNTGTGKWKKGDFDMLFSIGMLPDGDFVSGVMGESVSHSTSKMTATDRKAMISFLLSLPPIENRVKSKKPKKTGQDDW